MSGRHTLSIGEVARRMDGRSGSLSVQMQDQSLAKPRVRQARGGMTSIDPQHFVKLGRQMREDGLRWQRLELQSTRGSEFAWQ